MGIPNDSLNDGYALGPAPDLRVSEVSPAAVATRVFVLVAVLALGGCGTGPLSPMDQPARAIGDTEVWHTRTGTTTHTLVELDATSMRYEWLKAAARTQRRETVSRHGRRGRTVDASPTVPRRSP